MILLPTTVTAIAFILMCVTLDLRTRRIPNVLSGSTMLVGLALNAAYLGGAGVLVSLTGCVVVIALLLLPFALGGIGGGDVKMMAAIGALLGPRLAVTGLVAGMTFGGAVMTMHLARKGRLREKIAATRDMVVGTLVLRSLEPLRRPAADASAIALPYSVPLGAGVIAALLVAARSGV